MKNSTYLLCENYDHLNTVSLIEKPYFECKTVAVVSYYFFKTRKKFRDTVLLKKKLGYDLNSGISTVHPKKEVKKLCMVVYNYQSSSYKKYFHFFKHRYLLF